jgi:hypothetical protein
MTKEHWGRTRMAKPSRPLLTESAPSKAVEPPGKDHAFPGGSPLAFGCVTLY